MFEDRHTEEGIILIWGYLYIFCVAEIKVWLILLSLFIGILLGIFNIVPKKYLKVNNMVQKFGVIFLIFSMGISIGQNKSIISNLKTLGLKSAIFSMSTILFSIVVLYIVSTKFLNNCKDKE